MLRRKHAFISGLLGLALIGATLGVSPASAASSRLILISGENPVLINADGSNIELHRESSQTGISHYTGVTSKGDPVWVNQYEQPAENASPFQPTPNSKRNAGQWTSENPGWVDDSAQARQTPNSVIHQKMVPSFAIAKTRDSISFAQSSSSSDSVMTRNGQQVATATTGALTDSALQPNTAYQYTIATRSEGKTAERKFTIETLPADQKDAKIQAKAATLASVDLMQSEFTYRTFIQENSSK